MFYCTELWNGVFDDDRIQMKQDLYFSYKEFLMNSI